MAVGTASDEKTRKASREALWRFLGPSERCMLHMHARGTGGNGRTETEVHVSAHCRQPLGCDGEKSVEACRGLVSQVAIPDSVYPPYIRLNLVIMALQVHAALPLQIAF